MGTDYPHRRPKLGKFIRKECVTDAPPMALKELWNVHRAWVGGAGGDSITLREFRERLEKRGYRVDKGTASWLGFTRANVLRVHGLAHKSAARYSSAEAFMGLYVQSAPGRAVAAASLRRAYAEWAADRGVAALVPEDFYTYLRDSGVAVEKVGRLALPSGALRGVLAVKEVTCVGLESAALVKRSPGVGGVDTWIAETLAPTHRTLPARTLWEAYTAWAAQRGGGQCTRHQFTRRLQQAGYRVERVTYARTSDGRVVRNAAIVHGVSLRTTAEAVS